jgi:anti-sigma B factor antagonist
MADMLQSSVHHEEDRVTVRLDGELDCSNCDELTQLLHKAVNGGHRKVVVDLGGVTFMDSSGLRCLLQAAEHASDRDAQLVVERASGIVRRVLAVTGAEKALIPEVSDQDVSGQSVAS